jgi:hypothetical protein
LLLVDGFNLSHDVLHESFHILHVPRPSIVEAATAHTGDRGVALLLGEFGWGVPALYLLSTST